MSMVGTAVVVLARPRPRRARLQQAWVSPNLPSRAAHFTRARIFKTNEFGLMSIVVGCAVWLRYLHG